MTEVVQLTPAMMNHAVPADMAEPTHMTYAGVADADMTTADMTAADVPAANMAAAKMTTTDMTTAAMTATVATAMTTTMPPTVTTAVLRQGWRSARADHQHGDHREQGQPWKNCRAHGRPPIVGPGRDRSSAVPGVSIILGTVQRPIFPSCVGNGSCSSNGATVRPTQPPALRDDSGRSGQGRLATSLPSMSSTLAKPAASPLVGILAQAVSHLGRREYTTGTTGLN